MRRAAALALSWAAGISACSGAKGECQTTQDCAEKGSLYSCVDGTCQQSCEADVDCRDPEKPQEDNGLVCERRLCVASCPATACATGETCASGHCVVYQESFEAAAGHTGERVDLSSLGYLRIESFDGQARVANPTAVVAHEGAAGCDPRFGDPALCGGPAGDGSYFLMAARHPVPAMLTGVGCGACRCCLTCRDPQHRQEGAVGCPEGFTLPEVTQCSAEPPPACVGICAECETCPARPAGTFGDLMNVCEVQPAGHECAACLAYASCSGDCAEARAECLACREAATSADARARCTRQGRSGCYELPIHSPRSNLGEDDQAIDSPEIHLAAAPSSLVLAVEYLPFDVQPCWRRTVQGRPEVEWPVEQQELVVQLCAGNCDRRASWVDAELLVPVTPRAACPPGGPAAASRAAVPRQEELGNGVTFGRQNQADWSTMEISIPDAMKTDTFRFRLVPRLANGARVGIDRVIIRRRS